MTLVRSLNVKAGTIVGGAPTLTATKAANVLASTTGLSLVGALNKVNSTSGLDLAGVLNKLAGTSGRDVAAAAAAYSVASAATAPGTPTSVSASASGSTVTVTWTAPANGGAAITAYVVQRSPDGTTWTTQTDTDANATNATATLTSQANGTYTYRVAATNSVGTGSYGTSGSVVVTAATAPSAPSAFAQTNATTVIGSGASVVSWTAPANGGAAITSYSITYKYVSNDSGDVTPQITLVTSSQAGTSYSIAEAASHGVAPDAAGVGAQPRWREGNVGYQVIVTATNSVGTGPAGTYSFSTSGGS